MRSGNRLTSTTREVRLAPLAARVLEAMLLVAGVAIPLVFNPWSFNAFELPKVALLRALALLMALVATVYIIERKGRRQLPWKDHPSRYVVSAALGFGLAFGLATALSVNPGVSLWGSYARQQGMLTFGAYLILFLATALGLRTRIEADRLWRSLVWGSAPVVAYGLVQAAELDPIPWHTDAASRVLSTLGRSNFLGSYLVLVMPLTLGRALAVRRKWPYVALLLSQLVCLGAAEARAAWVGLAAAALTFALCWARAIRNRGLALRSLAMGVQIVGFIAPQNVPNGPLAPLARVAGMDRLSTLTRTDAGSTAARLTIWRAVGRLIAARPWIGYGPETTRAVFARVYPPQLVYYQGRDVMVDRAHNLWLDLGMSAGLAGVLALGGLVVGFGKMALRSLRATGDNWERALWVGLVSAGAGHLADMQFGFQVTGSATVFWLTMALGTAIERIASDGEQRGANLETEGEAIGVGPIVVPYLLATLAVLGAIGLVAVQPLLADIAYRKAWEISRPLEERVKFGQQAVHLWRLEPEYRLGLARLYLESRDFTVAEDQLAAADKLVEDDPTLWMARGELYSSWGEVEPSRYIRAEGAYRRLVELAPAVARHHVALGLVLAKQGRLEEGLAELERAVELDATDGLAFGILADLYSALGREAEASRARQLAAKWNETR